MSITHFRPERKDVMEEQSIRKLLTKLHWEHKDPGIQMHFLFMYTNMQKPEDASSQGLDQVKD